MKLFSYFFAFLMLLVTQTFSAQNKQFFNIAASGDSQSSIATTLCLNGKGPLTCQNYGLTQLNLNVTTTVPNRTYNAAGIRVNEQGYTLSGCSMISNGYCLFSVNDKTPTNIVITNTNAPWYPSIEAFEHYNSGRSHVFTQAAFGGSMSGSNTVTDARSAIDYYPSGYNMSYLDANHAYIYGGGYGDISTSIGAYVAQVDPNNLTSIWYQQLINTSQNGEWDYPGSLGILNDGYLYVSYGYRLSKLDPATGNVINTLVLPTGGGLPENTSFNGFNATVDGFLVMKSVYRQAGCIKQGPDALLHCSDPTDVPPSILVSVNPQTMQVVDTITLPAPVGARPTITQYNGRNYVYLLESTTAIRYAVDRGFFVRDRSWNPGTITLPGQTLCTSFAVVNDWVVAQTNTLPSATPLSVISINQGNARNQFSIQPFAGDPIPGYISLAFSTAAPGKQQAVSWAPMSVSGDSSTGLVYASDALPGKISAILVSQAGLQIVWTADQRTTEFTTLINPQATRVLVGTDIPTPQIPGSNTTDDVVWRNALTGAEIARTASPLPAMTQGTMIQPYYSGDMFYEGQEGTLIKLIPR